MCAMVSLSLSLSPSSGLIFFCFKLGHELLLLLQLEEDPQVGAVLARSVSHLRIEQQVQGVLTFCLHLGCSS